MRIALAIDPDQTSQFVHVKYGKLFMWTHIKTTIGWKGFYNLCRAQHPLASDPGSR